MGLDPGHLTAPYGSWKSRISPEQAAFQKTSNVVEDILLDSVNGHVYYSQVRPDEDGRSVIVDSASGKDLFGREWDARTRVHEYGGAAALVHSGELLFSHFGDNRVYKTDGKQTPKAITPAAVHQTLRFADFTVHPEYQDLIVATAEDHTDPHPSKVLNFIVLINSETGSLTKLITGSDFYCCARFSPSGNYITWQQWNFPEYPWQSSEICIAQVTTVSNTSIILGPHQRIAGAHGQSVAQDPSWTSFNTLHFVTDSDLSAERYCNPWIFTLEGDAQNPTKGESVPISPVPIQEEFGVPQWWLTRHGSGSIDQYHIAFIAFRNSPVPVLYVTDLRSRSFREVHTPYSNIQYLHGNGRGKVVGLGQFADSPPEIFEVKMDLTGQPVIRTIMGFGAQELPRDDISHPQFLTLRLSPDDRPCYVTYLPPKNRDYDGGTPGERPPVVVWAHGGPFNMEPTYFSLDRQFWTNRGWAYIDVHYGGSTGFGRDFRESLHGKWGLLDIQDCQQAVIELGKLGLVDPNRACICGESAGGYTTLQAATTLPDFFAAGAALYGVSDMKQLCDVLHKFEYWFADRLMGGSYEEIPHVWKERSPIYHVDKIKMPLLVLQGTLDPVVPAQQMIDMVKTITEHGGNAELLLFEGEGHGFRKRETIRKQLLKQLEFFSSAVGIANPQLD